MRCRTSERRRQENKLWSEGNTEFHRGEEEGVFSDCEVKVSLRNEPKSEPYRNKCVSTAGGTETGTAAIKHSIFRVERRLQSRQILRQSYKWTTHVTLSTHIQKKNVIFHIRKSNSE